ncbi:hypothetical protein RQP46_010922 [Phenoliferia psychrophenolica]
MVAIPPTLPAYLHAIYATLEPSQQEELASKFATATLVESSPATLAPPGTPRLVTSLPPEVLCKIFEYAWDWPTSLAAAAVACSAFTEPAQRALHTHVVLRPNDRTQREFDRKVDGWIASPGRQLYPIRSMIIGSHKATGVPGGPRSSGRALAVCDGVEELEIVCQSMKFVTLLSFPSLSSLRSLTMDYSKDWSPAPSRPIPDEVPFSLEHLRIGWPMGICDLIPALVPTTSRLRSLEIGNRMFTKDDLRTCRSHERVAAVLPNTFSTLQHLRFDLLSDLSTLLPLIPACTSLSKLTINFPVKRSSSQLERFLALGTALPLPATLSHLELTGEAIRFNTDPQNILEFIRLPNLANLTEIHLPTVGVFVLVETGDPVREELVQECRERGIAVRCRQEWI